jgi:membrane protein
MLGEQSPMSDVIRARARSVQSAVNGTSFAESVRRAREVELGYCALVLAAQQLMATIPLLVVLAALRPVAGSGNFGGELGRYLGLSAGATRKLESVFAGSLHVRGAATITGVILLAFFALGAAQAHQRVYELVWRMEQHKSGSWRRQLRWVAALLGYVALLATAGRLLDRRPAARPALIAICAVATAAFYCWSQRTLLAGRVPTRSLLPGVGITALGLTLLLVVAPALISSQVTGSVHQFGPIGVTFALASWLLAFSTLVVAGTVSGAAIVTHRHQRRHKHEKADRGVSA